MSVGSIGCAESLYTDNVSARDWRLMLLGGNHKLSVSSRSIYCLCWPTKIRCKIGVALMLVF